jgi:tetratricopeptide (TPR) repeat protein
MNSHYKTSRISVLLIVLLLPLFFVPTLLLPIGVAKSVLLALGTIVAFLSFIIDTLRSGKLVLPKSLIMWGAILLPLVYLLSSVFGSASNFSLFGYSLEVGTFAFILFSSVLFGITAITLTDISEIFKVYGALFLSLALLALFAVIKVISGGNLLVMNTFAGNMGNPIGAWTDYAVGFGLLAVLSQLALAMLDLTKKRRIFLNVVFVVSVVLLAIINFSTAWAVILGFSLLSLVYLLTVLKQKTRNIWPSVLLFVVALLFTINPVISSTGSIGTVVSGAFNVQNTDVRPSFSTTLSVAKDTIAKKAILGSGPNTFARDWFLYKPTTINTTVFWNTPFQFGTGFIPTQIAETGILGTLSWILFLVLFLMLGWKSLVKAPEDKAMKFAVTSSFVGALFLWISAIFYVPSIVILVLTFVLTGLFVASAKVLGIVSTKEFEFSNRVVTNFAAVLVSIVLVIGAVSIGFVSYQRTLSVVHFENALAYSNTPNTPVDKIESELTKAINLSPADTYYNALYQLSFARAQAVAQSTTGTAEANRQAFQTAISNSIAAAQSATTVSPANYQNWIVLGSIYESLVPAPLSVAGSFEASKAAYLEAQKRNPESPEPLLLMARLEYDNKNVDGARELIKQALVKKQDYADAYFLLTQLEAGANNIDDAITAASAGAILSPDNAGVFFELGLLKYTKKDYTGAVDALTKAITIVPNYANAQYFLGLSDEYLAKHDEAIAQFEALSKTNPDNADVQSILGNLQAGRDPLYKSPAGTKNPVNRPTPPITSQP